MDFAYTWESEKTHFFQMLISQPRNKIFKICKRLKLSTHNVLLTGAMGSKQDGFCDHLRIRKKTTVFKCLYLSLGKIFSKSVKDKTIYILRTIEWCYGTQTRWILWSPENQKKTTFFKCLYLSIGKRFSRSVKG